MSPYSADENKIGLLSFVFRREAAVYVWADPAPQIFGPGRASVVDADTLRRSLDPPLEAELRMAAPAGGWVTDDRIGGDRGSGRIYPSGYEGAPGDDQAVRACTMNGCKPSADGSCCLVGTDDDFSRGRGLPCRGRESEAPGMVSVAPSQFC